ncbi:MAG: hypothetical protein WC343_13670 [Bacilli bacterium]|jgi:hypothetical protein
MVESISVRRSILDRLPRLDRAVAVLMVEEGLMTIIEDVAEKPLGLTGV